VDQLGPPPPKNLEKLLQESILRIIWPLPGLLTILQKTLKKLTKNRTLDWLSTGFTVNSTDIFNIGMKYSTEMNPTPLAVFDEQHISSFKEFLFLELLVEIFFKALLKGMVRGVGDGNIILMDELGNKMNADGEQDSSAVYKLYPWDTVENIK
jgi:hypothetical protein